MNDTPFAAIHEAEVTWRADTPVSVLHDDPYFSLAGGAGETRHVFLSGNDLQRRFSALHPGDRFTVAETGFGTGLNFLETLALFDQCAPADARLHFLSTELRPLSLADLRRAQRAWPVHEARCRELQAQWPAATPGWHTLWFDRDRITLTLLYGDTTEQLRLLDGRVDAWFLDGFSPSRNDSMWRPELYQQMARLSHAHTTAATYSAAGHVRRGLADAGFSVTKQPGFAAKRDMTVASGVTDADEPATHQRRHVVVAGAGLAGVTTAAALAARGQSVTLLDPAGVATQGSGNLAGIVYSTPSAHMTDQNRFYQASYLHALGWMRRYAFPAEPSQGRLTGLLQLPGSERHRDKALAALAASFWPDTLMTPVDDSPPGSYLLPQAGYVNPQRWCQHLQLLYRIPVLEKAMTGYREKADGVLIELQDQAQPLRADALVIATAHDAARLAQLDVPLKKIRGQVTLVHATAASARIEQAVCHSGYWTPAIDGLHCVGASFNLHDHDPQARAEDDQANLSELRHNADHLWQAMGGEDVRLAGSRVGFRCQSPDFLPLAGALSSRVYCSVAHGSRGISGTPLCADLIAASICGETPIVDRRLRDALAPGRFRRRKERQGKSRTGNKPEPNTP